MGDVKEVGPWGKINEEGQWTTVITDHITRFKIYYGDEICGLDIEYRIKGTRQTLKVGDIAAKSTEFILPLDEYFNSISGYFSFKDGVSVVTQLTLGSNKKPPVTVGKKGDTHFSLENIKIVGFFGSASAVINAIGVYYVPV